ncbi:MAG: hypothetical protein ACK4WH_10230 [Phycisphaerales bacterium]
MTLVVMNRKNRFWSVIVKPDQEAAKVFKGLADRQGAKWWDRAAAAISDPLIGYSIRVGEEWPVG